MDAAAPKSNNQPVATAKQESLRQAALEAIRQSALKSTLPPSAEAPPPPNTITGFIYGVQLAHYDFAIWFHNPHGALYDTNMENFVDSRGIKREYVGYGLVAFVGLLLCTSMAPLVANLICIVYPLVATLRILHGTGPAVEAQRFLTYWALFAALTICDYKFGASTGYWIVKTVVCLYLYLPQLQGAGVVYSAILRPILDLINGYIDPKSRDRKPKTELHHSPLYLALYERALSNLHFGL